jgi:asparagine synthase (glutamine-hydrolysing)
MSPGHRRHAPPLEVLLSGGINSSAIMHLATASSNQPVETFAIAFDESTFDESPCAGGALH